MDEARERDGERTYLCIDLKTFYASVECIDRGSTRSSPSSW